MEYKDLLFELLAPLIRQEFRGSTVALGDKMDPGQVSLDPDMLQNLPFGVTTPKLRLHLGSDYIAIYKSNDT
jgi:hypothetical protein